MDPSWITAVVALSLAVAGAIGWCARWGWRLLRRTGHFLDAFFGQEAHDGVPARPGVMARLTTVEELIAKVVGETTPNNGHSLRDTVNRTALDVADIKAEQVRVRGDLAALQRKRRED